MLLLSLLIVQSLTVAVSPVRRRNLPDFHRLGTVPSTMIHSSDKTNSGLPHLRLLAVILRALNSHDKEKKAYFLLIFHPADPRGVS